MKISFHGMQMVVTFDDEKELQKLDTELKTYHKPQYRDNDPITPGEPKEFEFTPEYLKHMFSCCQFPWSTLYMCYWANLNK